jgi:hypothetical protein
LLDSIQGRSLLMPQVRTAGGLRQGKAALSLCV